MPFPYFTEDIIPCIRSYGTEAEPEPGRGFHSKLVTRRQVDLFRIEAYGTVRADAGSEAQMTTGGGLSGYESPDGRYLYYKDWGNAPLWKMPVSGGTAVKVIDAVAGARLYPN